MGTHPIFESNFDCLTDDDQMAETAINHRPQVLSGVTWRKYEIGESGVDGEESQGQGRC